ncbi:MAG TPA: TonB-dependent receptor [Bryobacteraceae bacterium]|jgi:hypothetical protein|nr:TonB-dependent receptor [Bryobacteraceae bacterium]
MKEILIALAMCLPVGVASAQTFGAITGHVNDPSGAVVPNATVTVTNMATNASRNTTTNTQGIYAFPDIIPATYSVKVTASGFAPQERTNVVIEVQQTARVDFALAVGQALQTVEVNTQTPMLSTEDASVGTVVETRRIAELPLNGRDYLQLVALAPNVSFGFPPPFQAAGREGGTRSTVTISLAGGRATWNNYTLDSVENTDVNFNLYIILPSVDALQEFKVQTGIYPAEFGRDLGQINVSTKSGTNSYNGTVFEFLRNDLFDAKPYDFVGTNAPKSPYRQNQYGFVLTGPISIPKVFNGKDRLFFMSNFEGFQSRLTQPTLFSMIAAPMRSGNFDLPGVPGLVDPNTRVVGANGATTFSYFPGNQIPVSRFNPSTVSLLKYDPLPNVGSPDALTNNYQAGERATVEKNQFNQRIDWSESSNSQWYGRYSWTNEFTTTPNITDDGQTLTTRANQWMLSNTRVVSPTKVNEARFGYSALYNQIAQQLAGVENVNAELGIPLPLATPNEWGVPQFNLANGLTTFGNTTNGPYITNDKIIEGVDNFSWNIGKHSIRYGGEYRYDKYPQFGNEYTRGAFTYNGYYTANPNTLAGGYSAADFLLGALEQGSMAVSLAQDRFNSNSLAAYIDDTYKITPKLTVTLGLRWEVEQPFYDAAQNEMNVQLNYPGIPNVADVHNPALQPVYVRAGNNGDFYQGLNFRYAGVTVPGSTLSTAPLATARDGRLGSRLLTTDWRNLAPRFGIAYSPSSKWVIRTGFGIFYDQESKNSIFDLVRGSAGRNNTLGNYGANNGPPALTMQNFVNVSTFPVEIQPGFLWGYQYNLPITYSMSYVANIQRQIGNNTTLEFGYNGLQDRKLYLLTNANPPLPGTSNYALRAPYPEWNVIQFGEPAGSGNYNGASVKVTQRFSSALTALLGYTYARAMDNSSSIRGINNDQFPENPRCLFCDYGPSGFDVRQRLVLSLLYELPFGAGRRFLDRGGFLNELVGGWQITSIITAQTGPPDNTSGWDSAGTLQNPVSNRLNCTGVSPYLPNPTANEYYNPAAFANNIGGTYGTCGRNVLYSPSTFNWDASVFKNFKVTEKQFLQFRAELFNAPNHPELGQPNLSYGTTNQTASSSFNKITSTSTINSAGSPAANGVMRQIQFALKYTF